MNDTGAAPQPSSGSPVSSTHLLRSRISRVCVAIAASTPEEMIEKASATARENPFLEFRLDYLPDPAAALPRLQQFLYELGEVTAIATCRRVPHGGKFRGSLAAQIEILEKAIAAGCDLIDIEIESVEQMKPAELNHVRSLGAALIISHHDFEATRDLDRTFERIRRFEPEFFKIVSTATCLADNLTMMRFLERTSDLANVIGICMGEQGLISRVLGVRAGSCFTFASAQSGEETGPGQIAARTLHEIYRIDQVSPATKIYGVVGNPVAHSLSPLIHNMAFRRETVNAVFLALQATKISDVMTLVREVPLHGLAVTMPFKEEILRQLTNSDTLSEKIGACNTVVRSHDGHLYGFNTDVAAIIRPLERRLAIKDARILVLGAGGAARAAVFGLKDKGAEVTICNRTPEAAQKLARQAHAKTIRYEHLAKASFDVIINSTPTGMHGNPTPSWLTPDQLNCRLVFDMVYNPIETPLLRMAREKGLAVITGVEMFVNQGARQFEIWTGKPAPEDEMLRAVVHTLRQRAENAEAAAEVLAPAKRLAPVVAAAAKPEAPPAPAAAPTSTAKAAAHAVKPAAAAAKPAPPAGKPSPAAAKSAATPAPATTKTAAAPSSPTKAAGHAVKPAAVAAKPVPASGKTKVVAQPAAGSKTALAPAKPSKAPAKTGIKPVAKTTAPPATKTGAKTTGAKTGAKPAAKSAAKPALKTAARPTAKPATRPTPRTVTVTRTAAKPVTAAHNGHKPAKPAAAGKTAPVAAKSASSKAKPAPAAAKKAVILSKVAAKAGPKSAVAAKQAAKPALIPTKSAASRKPAGKAHH